MLEDTYPDAMTQPEGTNHRRRSEDVYQRVDEVMDEVHAMRQELDESHSQESIMNRNVGGMTVGERIAQAAERERRLEEKIDANGHRIDVIADIVAGPVVGEDVDGNPVREGGLQELVKQSKNGGIKVHLPRWLIVAVVTPAITAMGMILAAIVQTLLS